MNSIQFHILLASIISKIKKYFKIRFFYSISTIIFMNSFLFVLYFAVGLWLLMIESGIFPHVKRGFYCDDRSITMRYNGETISTAAILSTILLVYPILWICEACYFIPISLKSSRIIESARRAWRWFKEYLFGMILHLFVVDGIKVCFVFLILRLNFSAIIASISKYKIFNFFLFQVLFGELRPHFLDTCRPDSYQTCTGG